MFADDPLILQNKTMFLFRGNKTDAVVGAVAASRLIIGERFSYNKRTVRRKCPANTAMRSSDALQKRRRCPQPSSAPQSWKTCFCILVAV